MERGLYRRQFGRGENVRRRGAGGRGPDRRLYAHAAARHAAPGEKWVYKTGETNLIGVLVTRVDRQEPGDLSDREGVAALRHGAGRVLDDRRDDAGSRRMLHVRVVARLCPDRSVRAGGRAPQDAASGARRLVRQRDAPPRRRPGGRASAMAINGGPIPRAGSGRREFSGRGSPSIRRSASSSRNRRRGPRQPEPNWVQRGWPSLTS